MANADYINQAPRLLTYRQVCDQIGFQKSWLWKAVAEGNFPPPAVRIGGEKKASVRWLESDVSAWINDAAKKA